LETPLGPLLAVADQKALYRLEFLDTDAPTLNSEHLPPLHSIAHELEQYFAGTLTHFTTPLHLEGTPFQKQVFAMLRTIPYGQTISYSELARKIQHPTARRAVGGANNRNPLLIVVPCHRVIAADGSLSGFRAGISRKEWLLKHEQNRAGEER
jgi:AraC family transcriptional regulator of adaptative response/methylated-DNA-[protein]-cysteine methyltransferase